ncbi:hypothetical protein DHEL01_v200629 [Diaporthe helianthi]|uniref:Fungal STAND N-terminal Goodbye domain-containing protein n=1 Tax=Diaporthe helianthi TaxID=158607 RepID=A0A2P5IEN0_DIAHE|nr:hypothetical protein DHEL01_v200629 [Diaporthe helianthi]
MERSNTPIPDLLVQSPTVDFIDNRLDKYHPAFSTPPSHYDQALGSFIVDDDVEGEATKATASTVADPPKERDPSTESLAVSTPGAALTPKPTSLSPRPAPKPLEAMEFWGSYFPQAMKQFISEHPNEPIHLLRAGRGIRNKDDWTQVFDQLEAVRNEYSNVDNKFKAGFRKVHRKFGDHAAEPLHRLTKLVPGGGELGSAAVTPIIGCVQIILEASKAAGIARKTMLGVFDDVDTMFAEIELFLQLYPGDQNIEKASINLIATTLFAVENVIAFFLKSTFKKMVSASWEREAYEQKTVDSLEAIKLQCKSLLREAEKTNKYHTVHTTKAILETVSSDAALQQIRASQLHPHELKNLMSEVLEELYIKNISKFNQQLTQQLNQQRREDYRQVTHFCLAFADALSSRSSQGQPPQIQISPAPLTYYITPQQILDWINIPDLASQDLKYIAAREKILVSEDGRARAEQLIRTRQMHEWMSAPASSQLLVHGNYDRRAYVSGLSLFCASLAGSLAEKAPRFFRILFFCGLHVDSTIINGHSGGRAMIQSLICQLVCQYDLSGRLQQHEVSQDRIQRGDVDELCALFERLVRQLPGDIVMFCLIDGIMYYEREEFREDMERVLRTVLQVSADPSISTSVKVLITSPAKTMEVRKPFPEDLILSMDSMTQPGAAATGRRLKRELQGELL